MKKVLLVILICSFLLVVCFLGKKKVECVQISSRVNIDFNVGFVMNKIKTIDFNSDMDLSKYSDAKIAVFEKQDFCNLFKQSMTAYRNAFDNCNQKIVNKHLKVYANLDVKKLDKNVLKEMNTPKNAKKYLENIGYTCTIK